LSGLLIGPANVEEDPIKTEDDEQPKLEEDGGQQEQQQAEDGGQSSEATNHASDGTSPIVESGSVGDSRESSSVTAHPVSVLYQFTPAYT